MESGSGASAASDEAAGVETKEKDAEAMTDEDNEDHKEPTETTDDEKAETEEKKPEATMETSLLEPPKIEAKIDPDSFGGVHQSAFNLFKRYHEQYGNYLIKYVEDWERVVSQRINGLLIHYRELQEIAIHYNKKVGGLLNKVDKSTSVRHKLAEKLDRNEIKEMGAVEARDTVGEHLYLYIEEVMERAWRDVFPLLLRSCRFEAEFSAATAGALSHLVAVAENIQRVGEGEECAILGRLDNLQKKHPEEVYTKENPFVKLSPRKAKAGSETGSVASDDAHGAEPTRYV